jgi:hypothetical protein
LVSTFISTLGKGLIFGVKTITFDDNFYNPDLNPPFSFKEETNFNKTWVNEYYGPIAVKFASQREDGSFKNSKDQHKTCIIAYVEYQRGSTIKSQRDLCLRKDMITIEGEKYSDPNFNQDLDYDPNTSIEAAFIDNSEWIDNGRNEMFKLNLSYENLKVDFFKPNGTNGTFYQPNKITCTVKMKAQVLKYKYDTW